MENIKTTYMPVGHVSRINNKSIGIGKFIKKNKIGLIVGGISMILFSTYVILIINFINLIKIIY